MCRYTARQPSTLTGNPTSSALSTTYRRDARHAPNGRSLLQARDLALENASLPRPRRFVRHPTAFCETPAGCSNPEIRGFPAPLTQNNVRAATSHASPRPPRETKITHPEAESNTVPPPDPQLSNQNHLLCIWETDRRGMPSRPQRPSHPAQSATLLAMVLNWLHGLGAMRTPRNRQRATQEI